MESGNANCNSKKKKITYRLFSNARVFNQNVKIATVLAGSVKDGGAFIKSYIRVHDRLSGAIVMESTTWKNGEFDFGGFVGGEFMIIAIDVARKKNAVIVDMIKPEPI